MGVTVHILFTALLSAKQSTDKLPHGLSKDAGSTRILCHLFDSSNILKTNLQQSGDIDLELLSEIKYIFKRSIFKILTKKLLFSLRMVVLFEMVLQVAAKEREDMAYLIQSFHIWHLNGVY